MRPRTTSSFCSARSTSVNRLPSSPATSTATPFSRTSSNRSGLTSTNVDSPGRRQENRTVVVEPKPSASARELAERP